MDTRRVRKVTVIPAIKPLEALRKKKRVAAYARVSTGSREQETSLVAQREYYEKLIRNNEEWLYVDVYYDDGISGLSFRNREGFNQMIADALDGRIDLILTKSLSRFARNTVDTLTTIRKLKDAGVEVFFEKENIYTMDAKGEFLITLMSSLAQEESRSISENITWGKRKHFADGKYEVAFAMFWGYEKGDDVVQMIINEEQAPIVKLIYALFLGGHSSYGIAAILDNLQIPIMRGDKGWCASTIESILSNEKYKGDALLQKSYTVDYLTKKMKKNEGEVPQYYLEKVHPAIVSDDVFALTQEMLQERRMRGDKYYSGTDPFSSKVICPNCGDTYGKKPSHKYVDNLLYYSQFWVCKSYYKKKCGSPKIRDEIVCGYFRLALVQLFTDYNDVIEFCKKTVLDYYGEVPQHYVEDLLYDLSRNNYRDWWIERLIRVLLVRVEVSMHHRLTYCFIDGSRRNFEYQPRNDRMLKTPDERKKQ